MRALVQRVSRASVRAGDEPVAAIGPGMLVLLGVAAEDGEPQADRMAEKLTRLRIFADQEGRMNEPLGQRQVLCVSQFTLYAETARGNRPSFTRAAPAESAERLYERVCTALDAERGRFGEHMEIELVNDGPVTVLVEV
jgi:D-aminoacyl-tRNA deacylase